MRNQGRNRRSRNHKEVDDPQLTMSRDDSQLQPYARHQHSSYHEDPHRIPASMPTRPEYDAGRDRTATGARGMREDDWAASGTHDRYGYDPYHPSHGEHDSYGASVRRGDNGWGPAGNDERYPSRGGWSHSYHHSEPSTSYQDSAAWNPTTPATAPYNMSPRYKSGMDHSYMPSNAYMPRSPNPYEERSPLAYDDTQGYYYEHWRGRDPRPSPPPDERMDYTQTDKRGNSQSWGRGHRSSKNGGSGSGGGQKFQSDSGWSGRRKGKEWSSQVPVEPPIQGYEDRSWEPAESWKSSNRQESPSQSRQQSSSSRSNSKQHKPTRRGASSGKQKKDKKGEDLNLNNWTRRDSSTSSKKNHEKAPSSSSRRKHPRSPSRSRSPDSVRSHHSSYRSRSSSPVPKRRRRESSTSRRSLSPDAHRYSAWLTPDPEDIMASKSRSPSPYGGHTPQRRRSPSSGSSARSRSRSASPHERRRPVHRLPTANPPAVQTSPVNTTTGKSKKSKKNRSNRQIATKQSSRGAQEDIQTMKADAISMPPPSLPPPSRVDRLSRQSTPDWRDGNLPASTLPPSHGIPLPPKPMTSLSIPASLPEKPARVGPAKHAGFKPIGQPNPALKMFFPGDEEEPDQSSSGNHGSVTRTDHQPAAKNKGFVPQKQQPHRNGLEDQNSVFQRNLPPHQATSWQSAPTSLPTSTGKETPHSLSTTSHKTNGLPAPPLPANAPESLVAYSPNPTPPWWADDDPKGRDLSASSVPFNPHGRPVPGLIQPSIPFARTGGYDSLKPTPQPSPTVPHPTTGGPPSWDTPPHPQVSSNVTPVPTPTPSAMLTPSQPPEPVNQDLYIIMNQVGEGTFGKVYKARNTASKIYVALKRIRMESEKDGFPVTAMREIKLLQSLKHPNVVRLYEMMVSKGSVFMVFEYMDHDLTGILSQTQFKFSDAHLKSLCHQMLAGLAYLHHKGVIHRDIKGSNILLNNRGELKLADFGLARFYQKRRRTDYTNRVITLWYRPPELLFGATVYGAEVDMWSAGCIMLELFTKKPVFQGNDEIHQLHVVFKILGAPTVDRWPGLPKLPWYELIKPKETLANRFREYFQKWMSPAALDLAERLLNFDPEQRVTAPDALQAPYFTQEQPMAELPTGLSTLDGEWHELESKQERMKKRKKPTESAAA